MAHPEDKAENARLQRDAEADSYPDFYDDEDADEGDEDGEYEDCGLMADGQCTKAGSEECDWICGALMAEEDDGCCPGCGACPGFIGAECDETCEHAQKDINDAPWDPSLAAS